MKSSTHTKNISTIDVPDLTMTLIDDAVFRSRTVLSDSEQNIFKTILMKHFKNIKCFEVLEQKTVSAEKYNNTMLEMFIRTKKMSCSDTTLKNYRQHISYFHEWITRPCNMISKEDVLDYFEYRKQPHIQINRNKKQTKVISDRTLNSDYRVLHTYYNWLCSIKECRTNPLWTIQPPKYSKKVRQPYTKNEIEELRNHCITPLERALLETLLHTGLRQSEIVQMRQDMICDDEIIIRGKGGKDRVIFLSGAMKYIDNYIQKTKPPQPYLWVNKYGHVLSKTMLYHMFRELGKRAGVPCQLHRFRHTFATVLLHEGVQLHVIMKLLGHEQIGTSTIYAKQNSLDTKHNFLKYMQGGV